MSVKIQTGEGDLITYTLGQGDEALAIGIRQCPAEMSSDPLEPPPYLLSISTDNLALHEKIHNTLSISTAMRSEVEGRTNSTDEDIEKPFTLEFEIKSSRFALVDVHRFLGHVLDKLKTANIITAQDETEIGAKWMELRPPTAGDIINWPTGRGPGRG